MNLVKSFDMADHVITFPNNPNYQDALDSVLLVIRAGISNGYQLTVPELLRSRCKEVSMKMQELIPSLHLVCGFFKGTEHWWLVDPEGNIVDPTVRQFACWPDVSPADYRVFNPETDHIYIGKCPNCGRENYGLQSEAPKYLCSTECEEDYAAYLKRG
jgi:hypothetical protein